MVPSQGIKLASYTSIVSFIYGIAQSLFLTLAMNWQTNPIQVYTQLSTLDSYIKYVLLSSLLVQYYL